MRNCPGIAALDFDDVFGQTDIHERLRNDIFERTETAMPQAHCFKVCELALRAQAQAKRLA